MKATHFLTAIFYIFLGVINQTEDKFKTDEPNFKTVE